MACNKNEWHPVHWINYCISTIAKIPSTEQDGGINVMSMGRNGSSLAWMTTTGESQTAVSDRAPYIAVILKPTGKGHNKQLYAKWLNWSHKFHSWISTEEIEDKLNNVYYIL